MCRRFDSGPVHFLFSGKSNPESGMCRQFDGVYPDMSGALSTFYFQEKAIPKTGMCRRLDFHHGGLTAGPVHSSFNVQFFNV